MLSLFISFTSVERDLSINIYNVECKVGEIGSKTDQKLVKKGFFLGIYANDHLSMYLYEFKDFLENVFLYDQRNRLKGFLFWLCVSVILLKICQMIGCRELLFKCFRN